MAISALRPWYLEFDLGLPHARQADRAGGLVEAGHAGIKRDADRVVGNVLFLEEETPFLHHLAIDPRADRAGELGRAGDQRGRRPEQLEGAPEQQEQQQEGQGGDLPIGLTPRPGLEQPCTTRAAGALARAADEEQVAVRIGADYRGGRFVVQPLIAPAPDQPPVAEHVAVAEEVAVQIGAGRVVDQFRKGPHEDFSQGALGRRFAPRLVEPLAEFGQVVAQQPLQVLGRGRLADHILKPSALVVADVEADGIFLPHRFGHHAAQPAEEDAIIRTCTIEHRHARFNGDGPIIAGIFRQINTHKSSSHSYISTKTEVLAQTRTVPPRRHHDKDCRAEREWDAMPSDLHGRETTVQTSTLNPACKSFNFPTWEKPVPRADG